MNHSTLWSVKDNQIVETRIYPNGEKEEIVHPEENWCNDHSMIGVIRVITDFALFLPFAVAIVIVMVCLFFSVSG